MGRTMTAKHASMFAPRLRGAAIRSYVVLLIAFLMLPVIVVMLASLTTTSYLTVPPKGLTLRWYAAVLQDNSYIDAIIFSLTLAMATTTPQLAPACYAALQRELARMQRDGVDAAELQPPLQGGRGGFQGFHRRLIERLSARKAAQE